MTYVTDKAIFAEKKAMQTIEEEQNERIKMYLKFKADPLEWKGSDSTLDDWDNCSEILSKFIIELQKHLKAVCGHLHQRSLEETTANLRQFTEMSLDVSLQPHLPYFS